MISGSGDGRVRRARRMRQVGLAGAATALVAAACGPGEDSGAAVHLSVYAASSLTEAVADLAGRFEAIRPEVDVRVTFAGSQVLALQIAEGAGADVFISADEEHMEALVDEGRVTEPRVIAHNQLVVIVPMGEAGAPASLAELPGAQRLVVGTQNVPVGRYTRRMLERAATVYGADFADAVARRIVSEESNARLVRAKVELGEADAAVVYRTDALTSRRVRVVTIPDEAQVRAAYPAGLVVSSGSGAEPERAEAARAFLAYLVSGEGQAILVRHGFLPATP